MIERTHDQSIASAEHSHNIVRLIYVYGLIISGKLQVFVKPQTSSFHYAKHTHTCICIAYATIAYCSATQSVRPRRSPSALDIECSGCDVHSDLHKLRWIVLFSTFPHLSTTEPSYKLIAIINVPVNCASACVLVKIVRLNKNTHTYTHAVVFVERQNMFRA